MTSPSGTGIVVFGAGRIGSSLAHGIAEADEFDAHVLVTTRSGAPSARTEGLSLVSNADGATRADYAFICTKPQDTAALLDEIRDDLRPDTVVVSFVSGLTTQWFEARLGAGRPVVRVMTTLAIELGCGASVAAGGAHATPDHMSVVNSLLTTVGTSVEAPEDYLDAVSGISGGGIAYFYFLVEVMTQAGVKEGLPVDLARDLLIQAAVGAGEMMRASGRHPAQLREDVMSRGGQTIAAFRELERHNVRDALFDAVAAAHARGRELASQSELDSRQSKSTNDENAEPV
ncbi:pyrroline-5-carboxylate reductase family protein [Streptomyces prunicolor]|uniref:pyrroline-5-carboxylate reductase family protein n=1 Tax=Streptomyces prunicolor TaxID=67348 RepID=UPI0037D2875B